MRLPVLHPTVNGLQRCRESGAKSSSFPVECFDATNTANFAAPDVILGGANFGQVTQLTADYTRRQIQFVLLVQF